MARARNIKPGFFKNEILAEMSAFDRLLFIGLWCLADREGRVEDRPKRIKMELFPCDTYDVDVGIEELRRSGFVTRYDIAGKKTISIVNFLIHQTPHGTEKDSDLPDENGNFTIHEREGGGYVSGKKRTNNVKSPEITVHAEFNVKTVPFSGALTVNPPLDNALNPDSLNPDSLNPELKVKAQAPKVLPLPDWIPLEAWDGYAEMRKKIRKPMTERAKGMVFKALEAMKAKGHDVGSVLDQSTKNTWIDVYEPKVQPKNVVQLVGFKRGSDEYAAAHKTAKWWADAGFESVWNAMDAGCYHDTAHRFAGGKKLREVAV